MHKTSQAGMNRHNRLLFLLNSCVILVDSYSVPGQFPVGSDWLLVGSGRLMLYKGQAYVNSVSH